MSGVLIFGSTKTHQQRYVVIPPFLVAMLREHLAEHDALVFTSPDGAMTPDWT